MRTKFRCVLNIFSFFLVMTAVYVVGHSSLIAFAADRMYTFNMDFEGMQGNLILVESNGQWGLMDGGHRNANTIQDADGRMISVPQSEGYSNQISMRNGKDVAQYMVNVLGVRHLDFIVGTHSHMDHIGGIPEIATTSFTDASGRTCYLVDSSTTYFYKEYQHIADFEDDLARYSDLSWHNQAYYYQATKTMQQQGANMVDVSKQQVIHGDPGNAYGDYVTFTMGNMSFRLYNVYEQTNTGNENVNSIVTVMTNGNYTVVNLSDINTNNAAIDKTSQAIGKDFDAVDVVVAGHHGYAGSNTKIMFDELQPDYVVVSSGNAHDSWLYTDCDLAAAIPYAQRLFGTSFFSTALSPYAIVTDLSGNQVYVYNLESNGALTDAFFKLIRSTNKTGWVSWVNTNETLWAFLQDGKPLTNAWKEWDDKWYHFGSDGLMETGFIGDEGGVRFCDSSGAMVTGWRFLNDRWCYFIPGAGYRVTDSWWTIDGERYCFDENGYIKTGFVDVDGGVCFCDSSGAMVTGWRFLNDRWCYFIPGAGYRVTDSWWDIEGNKYCFDENGYIRTGFIGDEGGVRFCDSNGVMVTGWRYLDDCWCYFIPGAGYRVTDSWWTIDGKMYCFDENGHMRTGWIEGEEGVRYCGENGAMVTGWKEIDGFWYYFVPGTGYRATNISWKIDGIEYNFDENGQIATGWIDGPEGTRYISANGLAITGWKEIDGFWYYFVPGSGYRVTNTTWNIDGIEYSFDKNGHIVTGWINDAQGTRYCSESGEMATGWKEIDGFWYYFVPGSNYRATNTWWNVDGIYYHFDENGHMQTGWIEVDGKTYYLTDRGEMVTGWQKIDDRDYYFYDSGDMARSTVIDGYYVNEDGVWVP